MARFSLFAGWHRWLNGPRPRILVWYFLLTSFSSVASILITHQIFYERIRNQSKVYISQQFESLRTIVREQQTAPNQPSDRAIASIFDTFLARYQAIDNDDYAITLIRGDIYQYTSLFPRALLTRDRDLLKRWGQLTETQQGSVQTSVGELFYKAEPIALNGQVQGVLVIVHCAKSSYQLVDRAVLLIIPATLGVMGIAAAIAWATAGRVLAPLRLLTQTAQSITESDMTQRIPLQGSGEIAELTATFNEMLDRLQIAFESQKEFLKDAGHELRTPITIMRGYLETLKYRPERQEEIIALVIDELDRMGRLVNDLLLLAKAERPDFLTLKPEELDWLTEELYLKVRSLANRDWKLESKGITPVMVDRQRLTQAVMNLVQNAIRHTQDGDTIALGSSVQDGQMHLWVRDTGEGIAPADQERIFQRFARATVRDHPFEGHGLGLAIVQAIAEAHGGWVKLSSRPGHGSTFTLVIPLDVNPHSPYESDSDHRRQSPHHRFSGIWSTGPRLHDHRR